LKYLKGYPPSLIAQIGQLAEQNKLGEMLLKRYSTTHALGTHTTASRRKGVSSNRNEKFALHRYLNQRRQSFSE
jgi:hypothetical protein